MYFASSGKMHRFFRFAQRQDDKRISDFCFCAIRVFRGWKGLQHHICSVANLDLTRQGPAHGAPLRDLQ
jgi:hypothetical protein